MIAVSKAKLMALLIIGSALSACATDYVQQLYQPNYGRWVLPSVEMDPASLANGPYVPKLWQGSCTAVDYRCAPPAFTP